MGMDLSGSWMKSTPNEIKKRLGDPCIHYNWSGWSFITSFLEKHGVDMSSFSGSNDGQLIPRDVCMIVAETIEKYLDELSPDDQIWLKPHIESWKWAKNYRQY
jgi:hypothetical protein